MRPAVLDPEIGPRSQELPREQNNDGKLSEDEPDREREEKHTLVACHVTPRLEALTLALPARSIAR